MAADVYKLEPKDNFYCKIATEDESTLLKLLLIEMFFFFFFF